MSHKRFLPVALTALIVIGLLIMGGSAIYRNGWSQGYMTGRLAAGGDDGAALPYAPYGLPGRYHGFSPFLCCLGPVFTVGLLFLLLIAVGKFFRFWAWKKADGPEGRNWAKHWSEHWHRHHGPMPPWCWEKPSPEEADEVKPDVESEEAETES